MQLFEVSKINFIYFPHYNFLTKIIIILSFFYKTDQKLVKNYATFGGKIVCLRGVAFRENFYLGPGIASRLHVWMMM